MFVLRWLWEDLIDGTPVEKVAIFLLLLTGAILGAVMFFGAIELLTLPLYV